MAMFTTAQTEQGRDGPGHGRSESGKQKPQLMDVFKSWASWRIEMIGQLNASPKE